MINTNISNNYNNFNIRKLIPNKCRTYNYQNCYNHLDTCSPRRGTRPSAKIYRPASCAARFGFRSRPLTEPEFQQLQSSGYQPKPEFGFGHLISTVRDPTTGRLRQVNYDPAYYQSMPTSEPAFGPQPGLGLGQTSQPFPFVEPSQIIPQQQFIDLTDDNKRGDDNIMKDANELDDIKRNANRDHDLKVEFENFIRNFGECSDPKYNKIRGKFLNDITGNGQHINIPKEYYFDENAKLTCDAIDLIYTKELGDLPSFKSNPNYYKKYPREIVNWWLSENQDDDENDVEGKDVDEDQDQDYESEDEIKNLLDQSSSDAEDREIEEMSDHDYANCHDMKYDNVRGKFLRQAGVEFEKRIPKNYYSLDDAGRQNACQALKIISDEEIRHRNDGPTYDKNSEFYNNKYPKNIIKWYFQN